MQPSISLRAAHRIASALSIAAGALFIACSRQGSAPNEFAGVVEFDDKEIAFEVPGRIATRLVERGDVVDAGSLIATLDNTLASAVRDARQSDLVAAESRVALLQAGPKQEDTRALSLRVDAARAAEKRVAETYARLQELAKSGATASANVDDLYRDLQRAKAERESLEAQLASLRRGVRSQEIDTAKSQADTARSALLLESERLQRHVLRAPSPGVVLDVHADPGETVGAGTPIVTLGAIDHPMVEVFVPQGNLAGIHVGQKADVRIDAISHPLAATVEHVSRTTEFTPRYLFSDRERPNLVVRVRVRVDGPKHELFAGIPARVTFQ